MYGIVPADSQHFSIKVLHSINIIGMKKKQMKVQSKKLCLFFLFSHCMRLKRRVHSRVLYLLILTMPLYDASLMLAKRETESIRIDWSRKKMVIMTCTKLKTYIHVYVSYRQGVFKKPRKRESYYTHKTLLKKTFRFHRSSRECVFAVICVC
jgi:hypothetical protein